MLKKIIAAAAVTAFVMAGCGQISETSDVSSDSSYVSETETSVSQATVTYTFTHTDDPEKFFEQKTPEGEDYSFACMRDIDEHLIGTNDHVKMLGRIWALFGEPDDPEFSEDYYCYTIEASGSDGNVLYLQVYDSGPSICGPVLGEYPEFDAAADQLCDLINSTEPVDYRWSGIQDEEFPDTVVYYIENGVPGCEDYFTRKWAAMEEKYGKDFIDSLDEDQQERLEYAYDSGIPYEDVKDMSDDEFQEILMKELLDEQKKEFCDEYDIPFDTVRDMNELDFLRYQVSVAFNVDYEEVSELSFWELIEYETSHMNDQQDGQ